MSKPININETLTFNPTGTTGSTNISTSTSYPLSNGYNSISNTSNYARLQLSASSTSTDCYIYYTFNVSGIPENATITSVACTARIYRKHVGQRVDLQMRARCFGFHFWPIQGRLSLAYLQRGALSCRRTRRSTCGLA